MAQILDPLPSSADGQALCCYVNATSQIQIARITNVPSWYFERVVFPGQRLAFEAYSWALLEIHTGHMASAIISDTIPCSRLRINQGTSSEGGSQPGQATGAYSSKVTQKVRGNSDTLAVPALSSVE
ncbi:MAG: DUF1830 domain-containing protein [Microcoleaceae cyanobacterium]